MQLPVHRDGAGSTRGGRKQYPGSHNRVRWRRHGASASADSRPTRVAWLSAMSVDNATQTATTRSQAHGVGDGSSSMRESTRAKNPVCRWSRALSNLSRLSPVLDLDQVAGPADIGDRRQTHQVGVGPLTVEAAVTWLHHTRADEVAEPGSLRWRPAAAPHCSRPERLRTRTGPLARRSPTRGPHPRPSCPSARGRAPWLPCLWISGWRRRNSSGLTVPAARSHVVRRQENLDTTPARPLAWIGQGDRGGSR